MADTSALSLTHEERQNISDLTWRWLAASAEAQPRSMRAPKESAGRRAMLAAQKQFLKGLPKWRGTDELDALLNVKGPDEVFKEARDFLARQDTLDALPSLADADESLGPLEERREEPREKRRAARYEEKARPSATSHIAPERKEIDVAPPLSAMLQPQVALHKAAKRKKSKSAIPATDPTAIMASEADYAQLQDTQLAFATLTPANAAKIKRHLRDALYDRPYILDQVHKGIENKIPSFKDSKTILRETLLSERLDKWQDQAVMSIICSVLDKTCTAQSLLQEAVDAPDAKHVPSGQFSRWTEIVARKKEADSTPQRHSNKHEFKSR